MASSSAFSGTTTMMIIISILLIMTNGWFGTVTVVDATYNCSGKKVSEAYDTDVAGLVSDLQQRVTHNSDTWKATSTVGSATGDASCDWTVTSDECLTCLGWAATNLSVDCKGRESGSSNGLGYCRMTFNRV